MGKASKLKKIRLIASQLPLINKGAIFGKRVKGSELLHKGVKEVQGEVINPFDTYREKSVVQMPLNHNKIMKRQYNKHGIAGVNGYIQAVNQYQKQQHEKSV